MHKTAAYHTLGCKLNFAETSTIARQLKGAGYQKVEFDEKADVYVINTCSVTDNADKECKFHIKRAMKANPEGLVVNTHVCRGNFHSTWAASGGYASVAEELFEQEEVNAYYLEFDTDRAGDFTPLAKVSGDKKVVLGLVTSKFGELESKEELISRIKEASQYVPLDRLSLSTQCGFASTEEGNILTEEQQWAKLALIKEVAEEVWGTEN